MSDEINGNRDKEIPKDATIGLNYWDLLGIILIAVGIVGLIFLFKFYYPV